MLQKIRRLIRNEPSHAIVKVFRRRDDRAGMTRLGRLMWDRTWHCPREVVQGSPMSFKVSFSWLHQPTFSWLTDWEGWSASVGWIRIHYRASHGGVFV